MQALIKVIRPFVSNHLVGPIAYKIFSVGRWLLQRSYPHWHSRRWSNLKLRQVAHFFQGDIINVSGWDDRDKEGGRYSDYFPRKASYTISNIHGSRGWSGSSNEVFIDLATKLPDEFRQKFNVVFNHTTIEHVYDIHAAVRNLCDLSSDIVIFIVPFKQDVHYDEGSYLDFWRPTHFALEKMFSKNGFEIVSLSDNENPVYNVYYFCVASRHPERWKNRFNQVNAPLRNTLNAYKATRPTA